MQQDRKSCCCCCCYWCYSGCFFHQSHTVQVCLTHFDFDLNYFPGKSAGLYVRAEVELDFGLEPHTADFGLL